MCVAVFPGSAGDAVANGEAKVLREADALRGSSALPATFAGALRGFGRDASSANREASIALAMASAACATRDASAARATFDETVPPS